MSSTTSLWVRWLSVPTAIVLVLLVHNHYAADQGPGGLPQDAQAVAAVRLLNAPVTAPGPMGLTTSAGTDAAVLDGEVAPLPAQRILNRTAGLTLLGGPLVPRSTQAHTFVGLDGEELGLVHRGLPPLYQALLPGVNEFGPVAAGDINGDGWPDVAVTDARGVILYLNLGGHFVQQRLEVGPVQGWLVTELALMDVTGDGLPELIVCGWKQPCRIFHNRHGTYSASDFVDLPADGAPAVHALAFADVDRDGDVDIVTGASSGLEWNFSPRQDQVVLWRNDGTGHFHREPLPGPPGETLSMLFIDLNGDGWPDLIAGNDFDEPDVVYLNHHGTLTLTTNPRLLPHTTTSTMSLDSGDVNNDGRPAIYEGAIAFGGGEPPQALEESRRAPGESCRQSFHNAPDLHACLTLGEFQTAVVRSRDETGVVECLHYVDPWLRQQCAAAGYLWNEAFVQLPAAGASRRLVEAECGLVPANLTLLVDVCKGVALAPLDRGQAEKLYPEFAPQVTDTNLLFSGGNSVWRDITKSGGVGFGGWTWNAKFADLDGDTHQDLFLTQGTRLRFTNSSNLFYRNVAGRFVDQAEAVGLEEHVPTGGSLFLDYDMDGRTDLLTQPLDLTAKLWRNDLAPARGFRVELDDLTSKNRSGVGARVELTNIDGRTQMRDIKGSGGFESHDDLAAAFSLGDWIAVSGIKVTWPDGTTQQLQALSLGPGRYTLKRTSRSS